MTTKQEHDKAIIENAPDECTHSRPESDYKYDNLGFALRDLNDIRELVALRDEVAELKKKQCKKLTFKKYETLVDINNHNYGCYESLVDGGYIKGSGV